MTKKELEAALVLKRRLNRLSAALEDLRATGGLRSGLSTAGTRSGKTGDAGQIAAELEVEIAELRKQWELEREIIWRTLIKHDLNIDERNVLKLRYVECKPWNYICMAIGYAERQMFRIHTAALEKLAVDGSP